MDINQFPVSIKDYRNLFCPYYNDCLSYAVENTWEHWSCLDCGYKNKQYLLDDILLSPDTAYPYYSVSPSLREQKTTF